MARSTEGLPFRLRGTTDIYNTVMPDGPAEIGAGRPAFLSTPVQTARDREHLHQFDVKGIPNLVQMQLDSYSWFLNTGLRELFDSFSPIEDFTGTMSLG